MYCYDLTKDTLSRSLDRN